jgi:hypothetical protein
MQYIEFPVKINLMAMKFTNNCGLMLISSVERILIKYVENDSYVNYVNLDANSEGKYL